MCYAGASSAQVHSYLQMAVRLGQPVTRRGSSPGESADTHVGGGGSCPPRASAEGDGKKIDVGACLRNPAMSHSQQAARARRNRATKPTVG